MKILLIDSQRKYIHPKELRKIKFEIIAGAFFFIRLRVGIYRGNYLEV